MKVLFADTLPDNAVTRLRDAGDTIVTNGDLTADDLPGALAGVDVLVVRSTRVTTEALDAADRLGLIVRAGAGTNTIDLARAAALGVFVCNVPGRNALAVAELTLGLLLAVDRHIAAATADLRRGKWNKSAYSKAEGLYGRRLGIIGLGDIGVAVAHRATGFGVDVVAVAKPDRPVEVTERAEAAGVTFVDDLATLLSTSDIVSLHVPGNAETKGMVGSDFLSKMQDKAILLNTSRGDVIDEPALIDAMNARGIRAGLDVFADEPGSGTGDFASELARHPSVVATHHVGASTEQAQDAVAAGTIDVVEAYRTGTVIDCVNMEARRARAATLTIRHHDKVGVLASVLGVLRTHKLNVSNMQNQIFAGAIAAVATIDVGRAPTDATLSALGDIPEVMAVSVSLPA